MQISAIGLSSMSGLQIPLYIKCVREKSIFFTSVCNFYKSPKREFKHCCRWDFLYGIILLLFKERVVLICRGSYFIVILSLGMFQKQEAIRVPYCLPKSMEELFCPIHFPLSVTQKLNTVLLSVPGRLETETSYAKGGKLSFVLFKKEFLWLD